MKSTRSLTIIIPLVFALCIPMVTQAAEGKGILVKEPEVIPVDAKASGWHRMLKGSANLSVGHSKSVVGTTDGTTLSFGYLVNSALGFLSKTGEHEWLNTLNLQLGYTRTPVIDTLIKTADSIDLKTSYLYHIPHIPWLGPFASFSLTTAMLPGDAVLSNDAKILKLGADETQLFDAAGNIIDKNGELINLQHARIDFKEAGKRIRLTPAFAPLTLRETIGVFAIPLDKKTVKIDLRVGAGAWETFVRDSYKIDDNASTANTLELRAMKDSVLVGPEFLAVISGILRDNVVYKFSTLIMYPLYRSIETDLEGGEMTNVEIEALVQVKLLDWLSLDYTLKALYLPFIINEWQVQNTLNITVSATLI